MLVHIHQGVQDGTGDVGGGICAPIGLMRGGRAATAPPPVEFTAFRQEDKKRLLINCVNFQEQLPNIPVDGIAMKVRLGGRKPRQLLLLPDERKIPYRVVGDMLEFTVPRLETFRMLALDYV